MLSPKMQRHVRVQDNQLLHLADRAQYDHSMVSRMNIETKQFNLKRMLSKGKKRRTTK